MGRKLRYIFHTLYLAVLLTSGSAFAHNTDIPEFASKICGITPADTVAVVPTGITALPDYAFADCTNLRRVELPSSLRKIGDYAFLGCTGLREITIPSSVAQIGEGAFRECSSLQSIAIPAKVTVVPRYMCAWCSDLRQVSLPSGL
ncbi:MAG: leucine-rich repeat domain-containing protein, partial [Muribaculaceae bacterium]|nr:leucine-rich repeat domain-containing protein [Muribaculaceae bacterium]